MRAWSVAALCCLAYVRARVRPAEKAALWALYTLSDGPNWRNNDGWDNATDPCRATSARVPYGPRASSPVAFTGDVYNATHWYGVGCVDPCDDYLDGPGCTAGRVSSLLLRDNGLNGSTTGWVGVGEMRNLTALDLSYNALSGALPTQLGLLRNLDLLTLRDNAFSGLLPTQLGAINSRGYRGSGALVELCVANNLLEGTLPESLEPHLSSLLMLDVGNNSISGTLPSSYSRLSMLQVLYTRHNTISGSLPNDLAPSPDGSGGLGELRFVELQRNALSGTLPPSIGALTRLSSMHAGGEALSGTLPSTFGLLTSLVFLHVNDNAVSGSLPSQLGLLNQLETFDAYNNPFTGDMPSQLARLVNLRLLYLPNEQLLPLRLRYCQQRIPNVGKYSYRIVREEYARMINSICPDPLDTLHAFGTLAQISGDV